MDDAAKAIILLAILSAGSRPVNSYCRVSEILDENPCGGTLYCDQDFSDAIDNILQMPCLAVYNDYSIYSAEDEPLRHVHQNFSITIEAKGFDALDINDSSILNQLSEHIDAISITNGKIKKVPDAIPSLRQAVTMDLSNNNIDSVDLAAFSAASSLRVLNMSYNNIVHLAVLARLGNNWSVPIETIDISHNNIQGTIKDCIPQYNTLRHLNLSCNYIETIHRTALENMTALLTLDISNNRITQLGSFLSGLMKLENLTLDHNNLMTINKNNFDNLHSLINLNISSNSLISIEYSSFNPLLALTQLDMSHNKINVLAKSMFQNNSHLCSLDVSFNNISKIESGAFAGAHVEDLKLHNNTLSGRLDAAAFNELYFEKLDLSDADVSELGPNLFGPNPSFKFLNFSKNVISKISTTTFRNLHHLVELDLSYNKIDYIQFDTSDLKNLTYFNINNNFIVLIRKQTLDPLINVKMIDFSNNAIDYFERSSFTNLKQLNSLNLKNNPLATIPQHAFNGLTSCYNLDLSYTKIKKLQNNTFSGMESLNRLNLSYSLIKKLEFNAFNGTGAIEFLDLSHNQIETFAINFTNWKLQQLLLATNNITYITKVYFQKLSDVSIIDLSNNSVSSIQPGSFQDCSMLRNLYLNSNNLSFLQFGVFQGLENLDTIDLSNNRFRRFDAKIFFNLPRRIYLDNNFIDKIDFKDFFGATLPIISIGGNLLSCEALMRSKARGWLQTVVAKRPRFETENVNGITCTTTAGLENVTKAQDGEMASEENAYLEQLIRLDTNSNRYLAAIFATLLIAMLVALAMFVYFKFRAKLGLNRTLSASRQALSNSIELE